MTREYQPPRHDPAPEEVNFDILRMVKAVSGDKTPMPEGLRREEYREWMRENAQRCRTR
jgi:hypothetical protein